MRRIRSFAALAACGLLMTGCSVLSGRSVAGPTPGRTTMPPARAGGADVLDAQFADPALVAEVLAAASTDFQSVYSYDYRDLAASRAAGQQATTGGYAAEYDAALHGRPAARVVADHLIQVAAARVTALVGLSGDRTSASVLVYGATTVATPNSNPFTRSVTVAIQLRKAAGDWRISRLDPSPDATGQVPGSRDLASATTTVRGVLSRLYSLHADRFDQEFAAALQRTTGDMRTTLLRRKASMLRALRRGRYDSRSTITALGVVRADGTGVEFLVALTEYHLRRGGGPAAKAGPFEHVLDVTTVSHDGTWWVNSATPLT